MALLSCFFFFFFKLVQTFKPNLRPIDANLCPSVPARPSDSLTPVYTEQKDGACLEISLYVHLWPTNQFPNIWDAMYKGDWQMVFNAICVSLPASRATTLQISTVLALDKVALAANDPKFVLIGWSQVYGSRGNGGAKVAWVRDIQMCVWVRTGKREEKSAMAEFEVGK